MTDSGHRAGKQWFASLCVLISFFVQTSTASSNYKDGHQKVGWTNSKQIQLLHKTSTSWLSGRQNCQPQGTRTLAQLPSCLRFQQTLPESFSKTCMYPWWFTMSAYQIPHSHRVHTCAHPTHPGLFNISSEYMVTKKTKKGSQMGFSLPFHFQRIWQM